MVILITQQKELQFLLNLDQFDHKKQNQAEKTQIDYLIQILLQKSLIIIKINKITMKKIMFYALIATILVSMGKCQSVKLEYIENGDFSNPSRFFDTAVLNFLPSWETQLIEHGVGYNYNYRWGFKTVVQLDVNQENAIIKQTLLLYKGKYELSLKYAARSLACSTSAYSIYWNNQKIVQQQANDDQIHELRLNVTAINGTNYIQIRGEGVPDGMGMTISDVSLKGACVCSYTPRSTKTAVNNSAFALPQLSPDSYITTDCIPCWQVNEKINVGYGKSFHNTFWPTNTAIVELDSGQSISQLVYIYYTNSVRKCNLEIDWAPNNKNGTVNPYNVNVYLNSVKIQTIVLRPASNYGPTKVKAKLQILEQGKFHNLTIQGAGPRDGVGIGITNIVFAPCTAATFTGTTCLSEIVNF